MSSEPDLEVSLTFGEIRASFRGPPSAAEAFFLGFVEKHLPAYSLARKIMLSYSLHELISSFSDLVKITPEGPRVWAEAAQLSDRALIALQLVAARIADEVGKADSAALSAKEIQQATALKEKSVSSRLSELNKEGHVERLLEGRTVKYRITTRGTHWLQEHLKKAVSR